MLQRNPLLARWPVVGDHGHGLTVGKIVEPLGTQPLAANSCRASVTLAMRVTKPLAVLAMILALGVADLSRASWITAQRPLSNSEWLAFEVSDADAIGVGHVISIRDAIVDIGPDGSGIGWRRGCGSV